MIKQLIFIAVLLLSGCSMDDDPVECTPVIIDQEQYANSESDIYEFEDIGLTTDGCLKITLSYGGGCGDVSAVLVDSGEVFGSDPAQRNLRLIFVDNDDCESLKRRDFYFDINNLQIDDDNEVLLKFTESDIFFLYAY